MARDYKNITKRAQRSKRRVDEDRLKAQTFSHNNKFGSFNHHQMMKKALEKETPFEEEES